MNELINYITQGDTEFTPTVMVGMIVFCMIFDGICTLIGSITKGVRR